ncbi:hypothetical protein DUNSADRAFT_6761, partial [Dunaliella salina]
MGLPSSVPPPQAPPSNGGAPPPPAAQAPAGGKAGRRSRWSEAADKGDSGGAEFQEDVTKLSAEEITRQLDQIRKAEALQISVTQAIAQGRDFTKLLFESGLTGDALNALVISSTTAAQ